MASAADQVVREILDIYSSLKFQPANINQYSILASIALRSNQSNSKNGSNHDLKVISLATGAKCLPESRLSSFGDIIHDSHAEILARRGFIRWLLEEVTRPCTAKTDFHNLNNITSSMWLQKRDDLGHKWRLAKGVTLHLYISTLPCGDASTRTLSLLPQDPQIAALKNADDQKSEIKHRIQSSNGLVATPTRGRNNYSLLGVLRTKPGRADSEPSFSMSCSDKIARWSILGIQGALLSTLFDPIYIDEIIIGGVDDAYKTMVKEDCDRAFWKRIDHKCVKNIPHPFALHSPAITFTALDFSFSRTSLESRLELEVSPTAANECLCWISDSNRFSKPEILINGLRRGVDNKQRLKPNLRPSLSKISLLTLYQDTLVKLNLPPLSDQTTYREGKLAATVYQEAKKLLNEDSGPFAEWIVRDEKWEKFTIVP